MLQKNRTLNQKILRRKMQKKKRGRKCVNVIEESNVGSENNEKENAGKKKRKKMCQCY